MLKKIMSVLIFVGFVGLLVFGAVNRTSARTGKYSADLSRVEEWTGSGQARDGSSGRNLSEEDHQIDGIVEKNGSGQNAASVQSRGSGKGNWARSGEDAYAANSEDHNPAVWSGLVSDVDSEGFRIETEDNGTLEIEGRTLRFITDSGFQLEEGDLVELTGFYEDGEYKVSSIRIPSSELTLLIRDETGRPYWSGGNRGN